MWVGMWFLCGCVGWLFVTDDERQLLIMISYQQQLTARALDIIIHMMREGDPGGADDGPPAGPVPDHGERVPNKISPVEAAHEVLYR